MGRLRLRLNAKFGASCQVCGLSPAVMVDHCHFSGLVRGVLCHDCNSQVDRCAHLSGCSYADYLSDPPAFGMGIRYPNKVTYTRFDFERAAALGVSNKATTPPAPQWIWDPPRRRTSE
ncbi:MAG: endonuclease VII domain-containing protein [Actinomycetia bacterium]|nr:endonuclease VII domain-containing protein [Actinomycetes bacterium]